MPRRLDVRERFGVAMLVLWVCWAALSSALAGQGLSPASPHVVAAVSLAAGVALGRLLVRRGGGWAMAVALLATTAFLLVAVLFTGGPAKAPTGYANANAALAVQLIGLTGLGLLAAPRTPRWPLATAALLGLGVTVANASVAALALGAPLLALVLALGRKPAQRHTATVAAVALGGLAVAVTATGVVALASQPSWPAWALRFLDPARQTMWRDALTLWQGNPVVGAGPGSFERVSALGGDPDTAAAHSSLLQVGAETGWVGVTLLLAIVLTGLGWAARGRPASAVVGVATWTALVVHSMTDHLVDFPAVMLAAGLVLGWSGASSEQLDVAESQSPR